MATPTRKQDPRPAQSILNDLDRLEEFKDHPEYQMLRHKAVTGDLSQEDTRRLAHERENTLDVDKISKVEAIVRSPLGAFEVMMQLYD